MDLPDFVWTEMESQLGMTGASYSAKQAFAYMMQSKPNSWHVQARIKGFAGNEIDGGIDHAFADLFVKENTQRDYLPLGTYIESTLGGAYDELGSLFNLPQVTSDDAGTNLDLNALGNLARALMPLAPNSTVPGFILPIGISFKDAYEALVAGIASNEAFISLFGSWDEFTSLIQWTSTLEDDSIHVEFDLLPLIQQFPTDVTLAAFPFLYDLAELAEGSRLDFDVSGVLCYLTIDYDPTGILDRIDLDVHVQGAVNHEDESGSFIIYIEFITLEGELPSIQFKHVQLITAEYLIAVPLIIGSACVVIAFFLLVKKKLVKRSRARGSRLPQVV
jgi:hypothetical protein